MELGLKERDRLCGAEEPRRYLLHELVAPDADAHSLLSEGATLQKNAPDRTRAADPDRPRLQAVYHMHTTDGEDPENSIPLSLQRIFYKLQYSDTSVSTKQLTKSFGWDT